MTGQLELARSLAESEGLSPAVLEQVDREIDALALTDSIEQVSAIFAKYKGLAEAVRTHDRAHHRANVFKEVEIRALRRIGELMAERPKHPPGPDKIGSAPDPNLPPTLTDMGIGKRRADVARKLAAIPAETFEQTVTTETEGGCADSADGLTIASVLRAAEMVKNPARQTPGGGSLSDEWYTHEIALRLVYELLGDPVDLDPCSNSADPARANVSAKRYHTAEDDGLSYVWRGRVFVNPPYGSALPEWTTKAVSEVESGNASEVLLLVPNSTSAGWYQNISRFPRCFPAKRLPMQHPDGSKAAAPPYSACIAYIGPRVAEFADVFSKLGAIHTEMRPYVGGAWNVEGDSR